MKKRQKEILQYSLNEEKKLLKYLEQTYQKASDEIKDYIRKLMKQYESTGLQSKVYQKKFQEALKKQIDKTLERIHSGVYQSIEDYRTDCYENGFLGAVYEMQGQGVPLIIPIDPEMMIKAITIDSKLSKSLYAALGISLDNLKKVVREEISRCFVQGIMYSQVADRINLRMNTGKYNAYRIARTEGQRITNEATYQAIVEAEKRGAQIVKQWCGILDGRIRPSHAELHGQIKQINEYFTVNGHSALYPSGFGVPSEDINCRCRLLQRAVWTIDDEGDGFINSGSFDEFKDKYRRKENAKESL